MSREGICFKVLRFRVGAGALGFKCFRFKSITEKGTKRPQTRRDVENTSESDNKQKKKKKTVCNAYS